MLGTKIWTDDVQNACEGTLPLAREVWCACASRAQSTDEEGESCGSTTSTQGWWWSLPARRENDSEMESERGTTMM